MNKFSLDYDDKKPLGNTSEYLPAIGVGTWGIRNNSSAIEALTYAVELGLNVIDTAEMYQSGKAEEIVGLVVKRVGRDRVFIVTKLFPERFSDDKVAIKATEASLRRLGIRYADLILIHWPASGIPIGTQIKSLEALIDRVDIEVKVTVREGAGTEKMAKFLGLNFDIIGKHGGKDPYGKLIASIQRMKELAEYAKKLKGYAFYTHSSVEGTRVAYGLGLRPIITSDDTPWSIYVANLIIPLCDYHIMPIWTKGLWSVKHSKNNHPTLVLYDGVKEVEWTKAIELNWKPRYILVREPEVEASYLNYEFKEFHLLAKDFNNVSYAKRYEGFYDMIELSTKIMGPIIVEVVAIHPSGKFSLL